MQVLADQNQIGAFVALSRLEFIEVMRMRGLLPPEEAQPETDQDRHERAKVVINEGHEAFYQGMHWGSNGGTTEGGLGKHPLWLLGYEAGKTNREAYQLGFDAGLTSSSPFEDSASEASDENGDGAAQETPETVQAPEETKVAPASENLPPVDPTWATPERQAVAYSEGLEAGFEARAEQCPDGYTRYPALKGQWHAGYNRGEVVRDRVFHGSAKGSQTPVGDAVQALQSFVKVTRGGNPMDMAQTVPFVPGADEIMEIIGEFLWSFPAQRIDALKALKPHAVGVGALGGLRAVICKYLDSIDALETARINRFWVVPERPNPSANEIASVAVLLATRYNLLPPAVLEPTTEGPTPPEVELQP